MLALRFILGIASGVKRVLADCKAEGRAQEHVGRPVVAGHEATEGNREGCAIRYDSRHGLGYSSASTEAMAQVNMAWPPGKEVFTE